MFLPYKKLTGKLKYFEVILEEKSKEIKLHKKMRKINEEYLEFKLIENRDNKNKITSIMETGNHILWEKNSFPILKEITELLNDKSEYRWKEIEKIIVNYLKKNNKYGIFDYTLANLTSFIGYVFRAKYELNNKDFEEFMDAEDSSQKEIRLNVFSKLKIFKELINIDASHFNKEQKGRKIIETILRFHHSHFMPNFTFYDPFYPDNFKPSNIFELDELHAMERLFKRELDKIDDQYQGKKDKQRLKKEELFDTYYYKRIKSLRNKRVIGAGLSFEEKENRLRKEAQDINFALVIILSSWGIHESHLARKCLSIYWDLFERRAWERQQEETKRLKQKNKWKKDVEEMKKIQKGQWDSNTMTLLGVIIAIFFSLFFGLPSIFNRLSLWLSFGIALIFTFLFVISFKSKSIRKFMIGIIKKILGKVEP